MHMNSPPQPVRAARPTRSHSRSRSLTVFRKPTQPDHPPWATADGGIEKWTDNLRDDFGCDEDSIKDLYLLAQHSEDGRRHANNIVAKMYKKRSDNSELSNPSGFLHSCVKTARHQLW